MYLFIAHCRIIMGLDRHQKWVARSGYSTSHTPQHSAYRFALCAED